MTNFQLKQSGSKLPITPEQALVLLPACGGVLVSLLLGFAGVVPLYTKSQEQAARLRLYQQNEQDLPLLRRQLTALDQREELSLQKERQLIKLVSPVEKLDTILTALNRLASKNSVMMVSVEPEKPPEQQEGKKKTSKAPADSKKKSKTQSLLDNPRFTSQGYLLVFNGGFRGIQQFLRDVEQLGVVVLLSDLDLSASNQSKGSASSGAPATGAAANDLTLKLRLVALAQAKTDPGSDSQPSEDDPTAPDINSDF